MSDHGGKSVARKRRARAGGALASALLAVAAIGVTGTREPATAATPYCDGPLQGSCLPTPVECATGAYDGYWYVGPASAPFLGATCDGEASGGDTRDPSDDERNLRLYVAGQADAVRGLLQIAGQHGLADQLPTSRGVGVCGMVVVDNVLQAGFWVDPNACNRPASRGGSAATGTRYRPAERGTGGAVSTISREASQVALDILKAGGNAVDAAAAATLAVGSIEQPSCGIGGGGFLLARLANGRAYALDFREVAPAAFDYEAVAATDEWRTGSGRRVVGVPGTVRGLAEAVRRLGRLEFATIVEPSATLAREGTVVSLAHAALYKLPSMGGGATNEERLRTYSPSSDLLQPDATGRPIAMHAGAILRQPQLAAALERIAAKGADEFYVGQTAQLIASDMREGGGFITGEDLAAYQPVWREPLSTPYKGHQVIAMPPPASGGLQVIQMLNILENDLEAHSSVEWAHLQLEAQKLAIADRDAYIGDPAFLDRPMLLARLTSKPYARERRALIGAVAGTYTGGLDGREPSSADQRDGMHTTHVSVIDAEGNAVSVTCTIEQGFGSAVVVPGTGILLNNQLTDFGTQDDPMNAPAPGKRPRSNTAPVIVAGGDGSLLALGANGGPLIPSGVTHVIRNAIDYDLEVGRAVDVARVHAFGGRAIVEQARLAEGVFQELARRGHLVMNGFEYDPLPGVRVVGIDGATGQRFAASDPRGGDGTGGMVEVPDPSS